MNLTIMEIQEIKDKITWEGFFSEVPEKTFLQSYNWGDFQKLLGHKIWRFGIFENGELIGLALVIKITAKRGTFLFVPHGPVLRSQDLNKKEEALSFLLKELQNLAKKESAIFIRIAPIWERNQENLAIFQKLGFQPAPLHIHPEKTWQLELQKSEDDLLQQMRKTTRYLIRKGLQDPALKSRQVSSQTISSHINLGMRIDTAGLQDLKLFYRLYQTTAARQHFVPFSLGYFEKEFLSLLVDDQVALFLAFYQETLVAGAMIVFWQDTAFYHHGASSHQYPKIPASYLLQWQAICEAKQRGCRLYNFWGITDDNLKSHGDKVNSQKDSTLNLKSHQEHPWAGLTFFKQGFGGYARTYLKTQDFVLSPKYWLNFAVEKVRKLKRRY